MVCKRENEIDPNLKEACQALIEATREAYIGQAETRFGKAMHTRMGKPKEGDLVVEITSRDNFEAVGTFLGMADIETWQVRSLATGEIRHWQNCVWVTVPTGKLRTEIFEALEGD